MTIMLIRSNLWQRSQALSSLLLLLVASLALTHGVQCNSETDEQKLEVVADESKNLDDEQLSDIVKDFGDGLKSTMDEEMNRLISEIESDGQSPRKRDEPKVISESELADLKEANQEAGEHIKARIELAGDNKGALPQAGLGSMATSFRAAASGRLSAAGSYVSNKMRSLSANIKRRIPDKLSRFFKWPTFLSFKIRFHKAYKSLREELYRQMIFLRNHIVVGMQHIRFLLRRDKHLTGQNQFSDITSKEYYEQVNNPLAETSASQLEPGSSIKLDPSTVAKLEALESEGKNIFGKTIVAEKATGGHVRRKRHAREDDESEQPQAKRQRRTKRDAGSSDKGDDFDELDDDETDFDEMELGNDLEQFSTKDQVTDELDPKDAYKLVEEFANGVDLDNLDDIENIIDDALDTNFKPIDLRSTNCIIKAENQNGCGCCYSYALHAAASYYNCMDEKRDSAERYHVRFVSDCGKYLTPEGQHPAINGCRGGRISLAYKFTQTLGVLPFADYNIARVFAKVSNNDTCAYPRPEKLEEHGWKARTKPVPMFKKSQFTLLEIDQIPLHLKTIGPVFVNARSWKGFKDYEAGIFDGFDEDERAVLHSMLIVGHDRDSNGREYYIILNSHGIVWGEYGYLKIYKESLEYFSALIGGLAPIEL